MEFLMHVLWGLPGACFWAALLSFIPTTLYLLFINPQIYEFHASRDIGIYILNEGSAQSLRERAQIRGVIAIYSVCLMAVCSDFFFKWSIRFDIISTAAVILFAISVLCYLPVIIYIILRNPWRHHEQGICLNVIYVAYGVCLLIFSVIFAFYWMRQHGILLNFADTISTAVFVFLSSVAVSYLPILAYFFMTEIKHCRVRRIHHPNILFIIYAVCFLVCAAVDFYSLTVTHAATKVIE